MSYFIGLIIVVLLLFAASFTRKYAQKIYTELISLVGGYIWLIADIKSDSEDVLFHNYTFKDINNLLIILGGIIFLVGIILGAKGKITQKDYNEMEGRFKSIKEEFYKLCSDQLMHIFSDFFSKSKGTGRVSFYKYQDEQFKLIGRYSPNPNYNKKGRLAYPSKEGFISKGWEKGEYIIGGIPKYVANGKEWRDYMRKECGLSDKVLRKMTMKSQSYYIYRVDNEDSRKQLGIVVFEQVKSDIIDKDGILNVFKEQEKQITILFKSMKTLDKND